MTETGTGDAQAFYGRWMRLYDLLAHRTPGIAALRRRAVEACRLEPGDTVVEMGCGTGANLPVLRSAVGPEGTVVGIDFTAPVLERARDLTERYDNVHVVRGDATTPPVSEPIDAVLATFVVGMLSDPAGAVEDWSRLVESGGHVVLVNAARSQRWYGPPVNAIFRAITVLSTPPTTKLRYETEPTRRLDERINQAHTALRENADAVAHETHALGVVRLTGGRIG
ncbi:class I SAM-dependent methyltransferase [Halostagnicola kamekurae]|uniref:Ubiquinone/menaquinone biosynthesis C-methylase UbiE n=1 Tax=Halostagnicola kamekurae TaxID=619731 RepID=A0A1I6SHW1_9EURY|nr:methyltransferase domain-containing protein [Halostagnicola kamekurae]SFS76513.1 Ubiquinone/menaquinone biosynthesis C-methylase UbiE [Halostagnicola kamekurae]